MDVIQHHLGQDRMNTSNNYAEKGHSFLWMLFFLWKLFITILFCKNRTIDCGQKLIVLNSPESW